MPIPTKELITHEAAIDRIAVLQERLWLIERIALDHIDGDDPPHDTYWSEIVGVAQGDPNWLQHARINHGGRS